MCNSEGDVRDRIELIPVGKFALNDRRGSGFNLEKSDEVIKASFALAAGQVLPIDFDHGLEAIHTKDGRAAGWITAMEVEGGKIMATVEWTSAGKAALADKIYRFISPVFLTRSKTDRRVTRILRAGLTNNPAIHDLAQVASKETDTVDPLLQWLAVELGMTDETDETKIKEAAQAKFAAAAEAGKIVEAAGLAGDLNETAATVICAKIAGAGDAPDPSKYVPKAMFDELSAKVEAQAKATAKSAAEQAVEAAKADGKLSPAMAEWAASYADKDLDGFKTWAASAPVIADGDELIPALKPAEDGQLTNEEKAVCTAMSISEEAFLATKQGKPLKKEEA